MLQYVCFLISLLGLYWSAFAQQKDSTFIKKDTLFKQTMERTIIQKHPYPLKTILKRKKRIPSFKTPPTPKKAALYAAFLPGAGQIYTKRYWKLPIVYGGFAGISYFVAYSAIERNGFREAFRLQADEDPSTQGSYRNITDVNTLRSQRDFHKRNLDISIFSLVAWYALTIVDASVEAHFFSYDISDDISIRLNPRMGLSHDKYFTHYYTSLQLNIFF